MEEIELEKSKPAPTLPPELLLIIMKQLEKDSAKATLATFMTANHVCHGLALPVLWEKIMIYHHSNRSVGDFSFDAMPWLIENASNKLKLVRDLSFSKMGNIDDFEEVQIQKIVEICLPQLRALTTDDFFNGQRAIWSVLCKGGPNACPYLERLMLEGAFEEDGSSILSAESLPKSIQHLSIEAGTFLVGSEQAAQLGKTRCHAPSGNPSANHSLSVFSELPSPSFENWSRYHQHVPSPRTRDSFRTLHRDCADPRCLSYLLNKLN